MTFSALTLTAMMLAVGAARAQSTQPCDRCGSATLAGSTVPHPETRWGIISDLPESFSGYGVLYATTPVLPKAPAPLATRTQVAAPDFTGIDDSFDVFFFHLLAETTATARLVVYVENKGTAPVSIRPHQAIQTEGIIGTTHQMEKELAEKVLSKNWDKESPVPARLEIAPGAGMVVAASRQFGSVEAGPDASRNRNCFGYVRALVDGPDHPALDVYVIAIPAGAPDNINTEAAQWKSVAATSHDKVSMANAPQGCAVGRAVGVYPNFLWQSAASAIDLATMPQDGATTFAMALPEVQSRTCADARQTTDLVLRPPYTRPDTIGNYMIEYRVAIPVTNTGDTTRTAALVFGKNEADIGLTYDVRFDTGSTGDIKPCMNALPKSDWAGPKQTDREKPMGSPFTLPPGSKGVISGRFLINGNSSLPFYLGVAIQ